MTTTVTTPKHYKISSVTRTERAVMWRKLFGRDSRVSATHDEHKRNAIARALTAGGVRPAQRR